MQNLIDDFDLVVKKLSDHIEVGLPYDVEYRIRKKDGIYVWWHDTGDSLRDEKGRAYQMSGACEDVTEKRFAEVQKLESASAEMAREVIEAMEDGVAIIDRNGIVKAVNPALLRMTCLSRVEVVDKKLIDVVPALIVVSSTNINKKNVMDMLSGRRLNKRVIEIVRPKKGILYVLASQSYIKSDDGKNGDIILTFKDVSEFKRLMDCEREQSENIKALIKVEKQKSSELQDAYQRLSDAQSRLVQSEKLSSLGQLSLGLAHELNSPLSGVVSLIRSYGRRMKGDAEAFEDFKAMEKACEQMASVIRGLNEFANPSSGRFAKVDCNELIDSTILISRNLLNRSRISIDSSLGKNLPSVKGDASQLKQAVLNMVMNARDAMSKGGTLKITTTRVADKKKQICADGL